MGKYSDFPSQTPQVRPKSAIYSPKRDDEHARHLLCHVVCYNRLDLETVLRLGSWTEIYTMAVCLLQLYTSSGTYIDFIVGSNI